MVKIILYLAATLFSFSASANTGGQIPASAIVYVLMYSAYMLSVGAGLFALYKLIDGIRNYTDLSQRDEHLSKKLAARLILAGLLLNPQGTVTMVTNTVIGDDGNKDGQCYAYQMNFDESMTKFQSDIKSIASTNSDPISRVKSRIYNAGSKAGEHECYTEPTSKFVQKLSGELADKESKLFDQLMSTKARFLIGLIQAIGLFFFFNAWIKMWAISEGTERQSTYKGQMLVVAMSSLIINLPKTAELIINTYGSITF
ncbi:hypothetical protein [Vibrio sp. D431a]|uniref:hypothetical protein n=1 Tax=Vibrio sp. D431a TaxID=2837388 RepID=UPI0025564E2E|nr:hypothetical protein [Vibrio sp. D431a]MDK9793282.1 hypothetical protein [Vibrio sp. D431a]